jgi:hypothetical protein
MTGSIRYRLVRRPLRPAILATNTDGSASVPSDTPESRFPSFLAIRITSTLSTLSTSSTSTFSTLLRLLSKIQRPTILSVWLASCPYRTCKNVMQERGGAMSLVFIFLRRWNKWYRVLRYRKGFGLLNSVRYGLWLAHS